MGEQISQLATKLQEQSIGGNQNDSSDAEFEKLKDELEKTKKAMEQVSEKLQSEMMKSFELMPQLQMLES